MDPGLIELCNCNLELIFLPGSNNYAFEIFYYYYSGVL